MRTYIVLAASVLILVLPFSARTEDLSEEEKGQSETNSYNAKVVYQKAQALKRQNLFEEAREEFAIIANLEEPGTKTWARLAADELEYGLLMYEANYWVLKLGSGEGSGNAYKGYLERAENLYRQIIELNSDKIERIIETQRKLDEIYISTRTLTNAERASASNHLHQLRQYMDEYYQQLNTWPIQRNVAEELTSILHHARLSPKRFLIKRYWKSDKGYYMIIKDMENGSDVKLKGDMYGSQMEPIK